MEETEGTKPAGEDAPAEGDGAEEPAEGDGAAEGGEESGGE